MEALGYVLIYLMRGELPWQSLKYDHASTKKQYLEKLAEKKMSTPIDKLCKVGMSLFLNYSYVKLD